MLNIFNLNPANFAPKSKKIKNSPKKNTILFYFLPSLPEIILYRLMK